MSSRMRLLAPTSAWLVLLLVPLSGALAQYRSGFDEVERVWTIENGLVSAVFQLTRQDTFEFRSFSNLRTHHEWTAPEGWGSSPIRLRIDDRWIDEKTRFRLVRQGVRSIGRQAYRRTIVLEDEQRRGRFTLQLEMFADQPVLRYRVLFQNLRAAVTKVTAADLAPWTFAAADTRVRVFRVNQWVAGGKLGNFEPLSTILAPGGRGVEVDSGAHGQHCGWVAMRDNDDHGLFAGWEFDGRAKAMVRHSADSYVQLNIPISSINHPVEPEEQFTLPAAFIGVFHGDWDEAGYRTQRFAETSLAPPMPAESFPYATWDSWGYQTEIDETLLRSNAEIAARLGIEAFVVDLGWARAIGDWHADPAKFPSGLRALSEYVRSLGMKFGLHFPLAEADARSPVLRTNPNWTSSENYFYFDAQSLCLSHRPVHEWLVSEAVRMIDDYDVDWILTDGENMVKRCTKTTHTHDPQDSNYSNSVEGLNTVVSEIQRLRPKVVWENCQNGGNMMTFNMVQRYVTSIAADDSGPMTTRQAVYGITYPFPPRYSDRYMPGESLDKYITRSYMFGGPWIFMNRLPLMDENSRELAASEIRLFKRLRGRIRDSKVFHLTARPAENRIDALQGYHPASDTALVFVYRPSAAASSRLLFLRGLNPENTYQVSFQEDTRHLTLTGRQLMEGGLRVDLPDRWWAEIVYVEPLKAAAPD